MVYRGGSPSWNSHEQMSSALPLIADMQADIVLRRCGPEGDIAPIILAPTKASTSRACSMKSWATGSVRFFRVTIPTGTGAIGCGASTTAPRPEDKCGPIVRRRDRQVCRAHREDTARDSGATRFACAIAPRMPSAKHMAGTSPAIATFASCVEWRYAAPLRSCPLIGSARRRLPVAAKIALVTAGWIIVAPGSPTPPHFLPGVGVM